MKVHKVTLLGHKDHGKSTLIGNLAIKTGSVSEYRINDAKKTSKKLGRVFEPGFILDSFSEEREQAMTFDTTRAQIKHGDVAFEFIDVPGHEELIKNMISGASYADLALLVVSVKKDEGIKPQTKRHLFIAKMLGIQAVVVAVNKMDLVKYDQETFENVRKNISEYLTKIGFNLNRVLFVPISAYTGDNLVEISTKTKWYKGVSLVSSLEKLSGLRLREEYGSIVSVQGFLGGEKTTLTGKVLSGRIKSGEVLELLPQKKQVKIDEIFVRGRSCPQTEHGDNVAIKTSTKIEGEVRGSTLFSTETKVKPTKTISSLVFAVTKIPKAPHILINGVLVPSDKFDITSTLDIVTGERLNSKKIPLLGAGYISVSLKKDVAVMPFAEVPEMGRFVIYDGKKFAGIGLVL